MKRLAMALTVLLALAFGCTKKVEVDAPTKPGTTMQKSGGELDELRRTWRTGFMSTCPGENPTPELTRLCECMADKAVSELTDAQLLDVEYAVDWIERTALPECRQAN